MENELVIILPPEVEELAVRISEEKKQEVSNVLNQIFAGTSDWKKQAEQIQVKDINDKMSMQLADVGRKNAKTARLEAEKLFDAKRLEVQMKMQDFKIEDSLWLKAKQTMQLLFKDIESTFEYKAKFAERYEAEQKELITRQRLFLTQKFNPEITRMEIENMSEEMFNIFLSGLEKQYNGKIEAEIKAEQERILKEEKEKLFYQRKLIIAPLMQFYNSENDGFIPLTIETTDVDFNFLVKKLNDLKEAEEKRQEQIKIENEKLRKANEAKELQLKKEREKALEAKAKADEKARQEKIKANEEIRKANEAKAKAEKELKAKQELEAKIKKENEAKAEKERKEKEKAENAPDKQKLIALIDSLVIPSRTLTSKKAVDIDSNIRIKFKSFKSWAKLQIETL